MRFEMNLASEPFRRDRAILLASGAVGALLALSLVILVSLILMDRKSMSQERAILARLDGQLSRIAADQRKVDTELRKTLGLVKGDAASVPTASPALEPAPAAKPAQARR